MFRTNLKTCPVVKTNLKTKTTLYSEWVLWFTIQDYLYVTPNILVDNISDNIWQNLEGLEDGLSGNADAVPEPDGDC